MRAAVLGDLSGPAALKLQQIDLPTEDAAVLIDVHAAGVNFPDLLATYGRYQSVATPPFVPGAEIAGVVRRVPSGCNLSIGQLVVALPGLGGYAERVAVSPERVLPAPPGLSAAEAVALVANHQTAYFALTERIGITPGSTVLALGAGGGLGGAVVQVASALGARVIALVRRPQGKPLAVAAGADAVVELSHGWPDRVRELTDNRGVDVVADPVGGDISGQALKLVATGGHLLTLGFAGGGIPEVGLNRVLLRNISVTGAAWGEWLRTEPHALGRVWTGLSDLVANGLRPHVTALYPLEEAGRALADLESGAIIGKAVICPSHEVGSSRQDSPGGA